MALEYVRNNIIRELFGRHFTEMARFRGLAIVLAEDVPAIAKIVPPGDPTYSPVDVTDWPLTSTLCSCLGYSLSRFQRVPCLR